LLFQPTGVKLSYLLRVATLPVIDLNLSRQAYGEDTDEADSLTENKFCAGGSVNGQATYNVRIPKTTADLWVILSW